MKNKKFLLWTLLILVILLSTIIYLNPKGVFTRAGWVVVGRLEREDNGLCFRRTRDQYGNLETSVRVKCPPTRKALQKAVDEAREAENEN